MDKDCEPLRVVYTTSNITQEDGWWLDYPGRCVMHKRGPDVTAYPISAGLEAYLAARTRSARA